MRVTSHCANHPSREAGQRCRSCGKWLCDRCATSFHGRVFCDARCRAHDLVKRKAAGVTTALRSPVPTVWVAICIVLSTLAAGSWITTLAMRLHAMSDETVTRPAQVPYAVAETVRDGDNLVIEIQGSPGATVVLFADGVPLKVLDLDSRGRGRLSGVELADDTHLAIAALAEKPEVVSPPPTRTPTATPTTSATTTPTRTATRTSTTTMSPTATSRPTRSPKPTQAAPPSATGTSTPSRHSVGAKPAVSPPVLHLVTDAGPRIAITFDGNASSNGTVELLELLQELDLDITLFVTGGFIERYPTLVRRAVLAGHEVGNHTFSHPHLTTYVDDKQHRLLPTVTKSSFHEQLTRTENAFRKATGRPMAPLWRAPFGEENSTLRSWALELGYLHVRWSSLEGASLDSLDWIADEHSRLYRDSERMIDRLLRFPRLEGGIVLMHLATERSEPPWSDLPRFVRELDKREVSPVKISDLLRASKTWKPWLDRAQRQHDQRFGE